MTREEIAMKLCAIREGESGWKCITDSGLEDYRTMADFVLCLLKAESPKPPAPTADRSPL